MANINPRAFNATVSKLRNFFLKKNFVEVHTQNRLSILAACEDPGTISTFNYSGTKWPLPQTGQMWLEYEMLKDPSPPGYFCLSTSYRNEPNPIDGRHELIFPMFEFELHGGIDKLQEMETELLTDLGYDCNFKEGDYEDMAKELNTVEIEHEHEQQLYKDFGPVFFLKNFPNYTSPFWNMKKKDDGEGAHKIDVILSGQETIGSAERSCNVEEMRNDFQNISDGQYASILYDQFGKERVNKELDEYFNNAFLPRSGGGIGVTRLIRSMQMEKLI